MHASRIYSGNICNRLYDDDLEKNPPKETKPVFSSRNHLAKLRNNTIWYYKQVRIHKANSRVYWAGAVMPENHEKNEILDILDIFENLTFLKILDISDSLKIIQKQKKAEKRKVISDRPTDRQTDRQT